MTHSRAWLSSAAVASLLFGLNFPDPNLAGGRAPLPQDLTVLAADETTGVDRQVRLKRMRKSPPRWARSQGRIRAMRVPGLKTTLQG